jgi:hypothetical protein
MSQARPEMERFWLSWGQVDQANPLSSTLSLKESRAWRVASPSTVPMSAIVSFAASRRMSCRYKLGCRSIDPLVYLSVFSCLVVVVVLLLLLHADRTLACFWVHHNVSTLKYPEG